jgi:CBS-domain-containing membrane protein
VRLRDILDPNVPIITADTAGHEVVERLVTPPSPRRLVVVDNMEHRHVVGIIADRDLVMRAHAQTRPGLLRMLRESIPFGHLTSQQQQESYRMQVRVAADVMSRNVVTALDETPLGEAVRLLVQGEIKLLPVVDRTGRLLGAVGRGTVLRALVANYATVGKET